MATRSTLGVKQITNYFNVRSGGPIKDLHLPLSAWVALDRAGITTLDQLRAQADRIQRFDGVGPKTALLLQQELARVSPAAEM
jgi:hypothetical protein